MTCEIINEIPGIEKLSYLELGIHDNINFNKINCEVKLSVDTNGKAIFTGTTDQFFYSNLEKKQSFDIIFIDANHDYEYVLEDFNNSSLYCNKWIILHDMVPPNIEHTRTGLCSNCYKLLYYIKTETDFESYTLDNNFGLTFVKMPVVKFLPSKENYELDFNTFKTYISTQKLYTNDEMTKILMEKTYV